MGANGVVAVSWKDVTKAEAYTLQFMNFGDNTTDPDGIAWKDKVLHQQQSGYVIFDGEALQPKPSVGVTGYWWKATAIGPEGLPGLDDGTPGRRCYVLPDAPQLLEPPQATIDDPGDYGNIAFRFTSAYTPSGEYHVLAVWGPPVGGATPIISGNPGGISQFGPSTLGLSGLKPSTAYQWDVRAHSDIPDSAGGVNWAYPRSEMRLYVTKPPQPPPPQTPWVWDWFFAGSAGLLMCVFGVVPDADTYQIEAQQVVGSVDANSPDWYVTLGALQPFTFHVPELESYTEDVNQWLLANDPTGPALPPSVYAAGLDNTQAGLSYRWHVKACAGNICSPYSQWAKWHEFFPWPF